MSAGINNPEFVALRQAQWQTPPDVIRSEVTKAIGIQVKDLQRIQKGGWNEVYKIETSADPIIVRISNEGRSFETEQWAKNKCASANVPVPKTLDTIKLNIEGKKAWMEISEFVEGQEMSDLFEKASDEEKQQLTKKAGTVLSRIHGIRLAKYGVLNNTPGDAGTQTLAEYKHKIADERTDLWTQGLKQGGFTPDQITKIIKELKVLYIKYDEIDPTLIHHDFSPRHLMVKDGRIIAVLDFGNCRSSTPFDEFANSTPVGFNLEWLKEGYENLGIIYLPDFNQRLELARLFGNLEQYPFAIKNNLTNKIKPISERIRKNLEGLSINY